MKVAKIVKRAIASAGCLLILVAAELFQLPTAKLSFHSRDESGAAVPSVTFSVSGEAAASKGGDTYRQQTGDSHGVCEVELKCRGEILATASKDGYYRNERIGYNFLVAPNALERAYSTKRWEPWNPSVDVSMKRIIKPIPMYARSVNRGVSSKEPVGFDMQEGAFLPPLGNGKVADLVFASNLAVRGERDYDVRIRVTFSNLKDGIRPFSVTKPLTGSVLRSPHQVPDAEFLSEWMVWRSCRPNQPEWSNYDPETHAYFVRVRTVLDKQGRIVSALYGKIYGDFMNFTSYLNPTTNDRNVEFDPGKNLILLKEEERVSSP